MYDKVCTNTVLYTAHACLAYVLTYCTSIVYILPCLRGVAWYCVIKVTVQGTRIQRYRKNRRTRADQSFF